TMRTNLFKKLSTVGEGLQVEYKTCSDKVSESLYETICSFLNHSGGNILVGVNDYGEIVGINKNKIETIKSNIITTIRNQQLFLPCPYFTPQVIEINEKVVLLLEIPCGQYVYRYKGRYWDRNGDADIDITDQPELLLSLFERKNPHLFEERIVKNLTINDLDRATFQFCRNILAAKKTNHPWIHLSDEEILIKTLIHRAFPVLQKLNRLHHPGIFQGIVADKGKPHRPSGRQRHLHQAHPLRHKEAFLLAVLVGMQLGYQLYFCIGITFYTLKIFQYTLPLQYTKSTNKQNYNTISIISLAGTVISACGYTPPPAPRCPCRLY
ncbi:MAG: putative DNA binding domain-containing protein, partial [Selenomonadaceae bacterium]|nr:putative DNA binding domain-containing protein [Selenomonadaceae bacterium]